MHFEGEPKSNVTMFLILDEKSQYPCISRQAQMVDRMDNWATSLGDLGTLELPSSAEAFFGDPALIFLASEVEPQSLDLKPRRLWLITRGSCDTTVIPLLWGGKCLWGSAIFFVSQKWVPFPTALVRLISVLCLLLWLASIDTHSRSFGDTLPVFVAVGARRAYQGPIPR